MLTSQELREIATAMEALNSAVMKEVSLHVTATVYDSAGEDVGTIENFRDEGDETLFFYPKSTS